MLIIAFKKGSSDWLNLYLTLRFRKKKTNNKSLQLKFYLQKIKTTKVCFLMKDNFLPM